MKNRNVWIYMFCIPVLIGAYGIFSVLTTYSGDRKSSQETWEVYVTRHIRECRNMRARQTSCFSDFVRLWLSQSPVVTAMKTLQSIEREPDVFPVCHAITHLIGRQSYRNAPEAQKAYAGCMTVCGAGCYHGVLEEYLNTKQIKKISILEDVRAICGTRSNAYDIPAYNECLHGVGHGFMYLNDMDLPKALVRCDGFSDHPDRQECYGGVFMENAIGESRADHPSKYTKPDDPIYPCKTLDLVYKASCYGQKSSDFGDRVSWDSQKVIQFCRNLPAEYQNQCYTRLGGGAAQFFTDMSQLKNVCNDVAGHIHQIACIQAAAGVLLELYDPDRKSAEAYCASLSAENKTGCYEQIRQY